VVRNRSYELGLGVRRFFRHRDVLQMSVGGAGVGLLNPAIVAGGCGPSGPLVQPGCAYDRAEDQGAVTKKSSDDDWSESLSMRLDMRVSPEFHEAIDEW